MTRAEKIEKAANTYAEEICEDCDCVNQVALENFHAALALPADPAPASEVEKAEDEVVEAANNWHFGTDHHLVREEDLMRAVVHLAARLAALGQEK